MVKESVAKNDDPTSINDMIHHVEPSESRPQSQAIALGVIGTSFVGIVGLASPFVLMQFRSVLPWMATPRTKVLNALKFIDSQKQQAKSSSQQNLRALNRSRRYYDLGSGDGETVFAAASLGWRATGFELNSTLWLISSIRRLASTDRHRATFVLGDFWKQNIADADAVMVFGVNPLMPRLAAKMQAECQPGTYVLSYRFHVPLLPQDNNDDASQNTTTDGEVTSKLAADLVYDQEEMRIYRIRD